MVQSKHYSEAIQLGKKLVAELNKNDNDDTLSKWMAHYLSELVLRIDSEKGEQKAQLQKECAELILKIWKQKRRGNPDLHPFANLDSTLRVLNTLASESPRLWSFPRLQRDNDPWEQFSERIEKTSYSAFKEVLRFTLASDVFESVMEFKDDFGSLLDDDENEVIEKLHLIIKRTDSSVFHEERIKLPMELKKELTIFRLEKLIDKQKKALDELRQRVDDLE
jgi:hypothetical protein